MSSNDDQRNWASIFRNIGVKKGSNQKWGKRDEEKCEMKRLSSGENVKDNGSIWIKYSQARTFESSALMIIKSTKA